MICSLLWHWAISRWMRSRSRWACGASVASDSGVPLVLTSGNLSDEPIAFADEDALNRLRTIADRFLAAVVDDAYQAEATAANLHADSARPGVERVLDQLLDNRGGALDYLNVRTVRLPSGLRTLRVKETDRIRAVELELAKVGVDVRAFSLADSQGEPDEGMHIIPPSCGIDPTPSAPRVEFDTYDDHRIAMSFALTGLRAPGIRIVNPGCVSKTFPEYFDVLRGLSA